MQIILYTNGTRATGNHPVAKDCASVVCAELGKDNGKILGIGGEVYLIYSTGKTTEIYAVIAELTEPKKEEPEPVAVEPEPVEVKAESKTVSQPTATAVRTRRRRA